LREAIVKFAAALEIRPDMHEAFFNWGGALMSIADLHEGHDREALLSEAVEKHTKGIGIEPDDYEALYNLCNALSMLAYNYKGRQRTETLEAALEKAKRVEDLKPGSGIYCMACIYALLGQEKNALASLKKATESDPQYRQIAAADEDFRSLWEVRAFKDIVAT
jgi:tetratricopeptide (TPR) repeat protein